MSTSGSMSSLRSVVSTGTCEDGINNLDLPDSEDEDAAKVVIDLRSLWSVLEDVAKCPVCLSLPISPPVTLCVNGHGICSSCKPALDNCPTCRQPFCEINPRILNEILQTIPKVCKFYDRGCRLDTSHDHEIYCDWRHVKCIFQNKEDTGYCEWEGDALNLHNHDNVDFQHLGNIFIDVDWDDGTFKFSDFNNLSQTKFCFRNLQLPISPWFDLSQYVCYCAKTQGNFCLYIKDFLPKEPRIITYVLISFENGKIGDIYKYKIKVTTMATPEREVKLEENLYCMRVPLEEVDKCVDENGDLYVSYMKITEPL